jgi:septal ring factor EnvC (AmiA/AmiB activator)
VTDPVVSRRELDIMKADADREHAQLREALHTLDVSGSRGVVGLQVQMQDTTKEIAKLQASVDALRSDIDRRFDGHTRVHEAEAAARASSRRQAAGLVIAAIAAVDGPLVTILLARGH